MKNLRIALPLAIVLGWAAAAAAAGNPDAVDFGMIGLAQSQTAVLTAVLTGPIDARHPGCPTELSFVDAQGQVFRDRDGNEIKQTFVLHGNVAVSLTLNADDILTGGELRKSIRAVVADPLDDGTHADCRQRKVSRETLDERGYTLTVTEYSFAIERKPTPPPPAR